MFQSRFASILILAAAAGTLGACASSPRYVAADNVDDVGHYSTRLGEQRYRVVYNGDRSTGLNTTRNYALLRAAQLTLREGYDWFEVTDRDTATLEQSRPTTEWSVEHAWYVERDCGLLGCTQSATPYTTTRVDTGSTARRERYSQMLEIVMGKGPMPTGGGDYYDADTVEKSLVESM